MEIKILDNRLADVLQPKTKGSAGIDLHACISESLYLAPGQVELIPTGMAIHINDPSLAAMLLPRSGLGHKQGIILGNSVGLIDSDYQNQWFVSIWNRGSSLQVIQPMERIAQAIFVPVVCPEFKVVEEFNKKSERVGGFGSTGK